MRKRKINSKKPMFKKRRSASRTFFNAVLIILLLAAFAFLGYSVGKPIVEFLGDRGGRSPKPPVSDNDVTDGEKVSESTPKISETAPATEAPEPEPPQPEKKGILFVSMPAATPYDGWLDEWIDYAVGGDYYGLALELVADGGSIGYSTENTLAVGAGAISPNALTDLSAAAKKISDAGLLPYARISLLSDHIASWFDKSVCYLFENSTSTWLDDSVSNGGKPWISAFSENARAYISSLVAEISKAGFAGIIAGEIEFPPFRNSDLTYIGEKVKSADRYLALAEFSNAVQDALGSAKSYAVEIDAQDIISGRAELVKALSTLNAQTVYVRYDSAAIGLRIEKQDDTAASYEGLSEADKMTVIVRSVREILGDGKTVQIAVTGEEAMDKAEELGFEAEGIMIYQ